MNNCSESPSTSLIDSVPSFTALIKKSAELFRENDGKKLRNTTV